MKGRHPEKNPSHHALEQTNPLFPALEEIEDPPTENRSDEKEGQKTNDEFPIRMTPIDKGGGNAGRYEHRQKQADRERNSDWSEGILQNKGVNRHRQVARSGSPPLLMPMMSAPRAKRAQCVTVNSSTPGWFCFRRLAREWA